MPVRNRNSSKKEPKVSTDIIVIRIPRNFAMRSPLEELITYPGMTGRMAYLIVTRLNLRTEEDMAVFKNIADAVELYERAMVLSVMDREPILTDFDKHALLNGLRLAVFHINKTNRKPEIDKLMQFPGMMDVSARYLYKIGVTLAELKSNYHKAAIDYYAMVVEQCDLSPYEGYILFENLQEILTAVPADPYGPPNPTGGGG